MSAGDVAVMTSPKADVNKCRSGACKQVRKDVGAWKHVEARAEGFRRVEACGTRELWRRIVKWRVTVRVSSDGGQVSIRW